MRTVRFGFGEVDYDEVLKHNGDHAIDQIFSDLGRFFRIIETNAYLLRRYSEMETPPEMEKFHDRAAAIEHAMEDIWQISAATYDFFHPGDPAQKPDPTTSE